MKKLYMICLLLCCGVSPAQVPQLFMDINPGAYHSFPNNIVTQGGKVYFGAEDGVNSYGLWSSDGTIGGTSMIFEVGPDLVNDGVFEIIPALGKIFFTAQNTTGGTGMELYVSDGTTAGTFMLKDIYAGTNGSDPGSFCEMNGQLYFSADDGINGRELWKTDGTTAGTLLVHDIHPAGSSGPLYTFSFNNKLYFSADNGTDGRELHTSDGVAIQSFDLNNGSAHSSPKGFTVLNSELFFIAETGATNYDLAKTDGTNFSIVKNLISGNYLQFSMIAYNNKLFISGFETLPDNELWTSDGTTSGTQLFMNINATSGSYPRDFTIANNLLFFKANNGTSIDLYVTDGTVSGTSIVKANVMDVFTEFDDKIFFGSEYTSAQWGSFQALWSSAGTAASNTTLLPVTDTFDIEVFTLDVYTMAELNNYLYFMAFDFSGSKGWELYRVPGVKNALNEMNKNYLCIYPNPSHDFIFLQNVQELKNASVNIFDISGRMVLDKNLFPKENMIDVSGLVEGCYMVVVTSNDTYLCNKFVKR